MITPTRRPYFAAALTAAAFTITACGGPMPDPATVTDARSVAETRLTNLAAATLVDAPSTVPVIRSLLRASAYPTAGPDGAVTYPAVVESVHDGDTLRVIGLVREGLADDAESARLVRVTVRLAGINTPELNDADPSDRARAREARDRLRQLAPDGALVTVTDRGREKYGRTLADITLHRGGSVAVALIAEGHGKPYAGGAR